MPSTGVIIWKGDAGRPEKHEVKSVISNPSDNAALTTFATAMEAHTDCVKVKEQFTSKVIADASPPGTGQNVDRVATIYMTDVDTGLAVKFSYPCPIDAETEVTDEGERLLVASALAIVGLLETLTGKTLLFNTSSVTQSR